MISTTNILVGGAVVRGGQCSPPHPPLDETLICTNIDIWRTSDNVPDCSSVDSECVNEVAVKQVPEFHCEIWEGITNDIIITSSFIEITQES